MKRYLCHPCGAIRRAPGVFDDARRPVLADPTERRADWPRHCGRPMVRLTDEQYRAARGLPKHLRRPWAAAGLHILTDRPGRGRTVYRAAVWPRQVREATRRAAEAERRRDEADVAAERRRRADVERLAGELARERVPPTADEVGRWLGWNSGAVRVLARLARDGWRTDLLPILADALEEAGCGDPRLTGPCRRGSPEAECRWVLRVLLGADGLPAPDAASSEAEAGGRPGEEPWSGSDLTHS